jgi:hypothetical protein
MTSFVGRPKIDHGLQCAFHFSPEYSNMRVATAEIFWLTIEANV